MDEEYEKRLRDLVAFIHGDAPAPTVYNSEVARPTSSMGSQLIGPDGVPSAMTDWLAAARQLPRMHPDIPAATDPNYVAPPTTNGETDANRRARMGARGMASNRATYVPPIAPPVLYGVRSQLDADRKRGLPPTPNPYLMPGR